MSPRYNSHSPAVLCHHTAMSVLLVAVLVSGALALVSAGTPPPQNLQEASHRLDMILNNTRSRENYIRCFMDRGICNKDALSIKHILTDALASNCTNCTQVQRLGAERFFQYLQTNQPDTWANLRGKYGKEEEDDDDDESEDSDESDDDDRPTDKNGQQPEQSAKGAQHPAVTESSGTAQANNTVSTTIDMVF